MGKFFPDYRTATPEQVRAYKDAEKQRYTQERYERRPWTRRPEAGDDIYHRLNDRVNDAGQPLSRTQQWWHRERAATEVDRDFTRRQRASDRQDHRSRGRTR